MLRHIFADGGYAGDKLQGAPRQHGPAGRRDHQAHSDLDLCVGSVSLALMNLALAVYQDGEIRRSLEDVPVELDSHGNWLRRHGGDIEIQLGKHEKEQFRRGFPGDETGSATRIEIGSIVAVEMADDRWMVCLTGTGEISMPRGHANPILFAFTV